MGRPIKKIFIGERGLGGSLASVTLGGTNNSTGYTAAAALTIGAPDDAAGVQAVGEVTVFADGALVEGSSDLTPTGTGIDGVGGAAEVLTGQSGTVTGAGSGAEFTITKANTNGIVDYSDISVVITTPGSGYLLTDTIVILGTAFTGGASPANDLTLAVDTFVANGTVSGTTITEAGSGYDTAPTVSGATGTQGTLTMTGVLGTAAGSIIAATAYVTGTNLDADIKAQKGDTTYRVTTSEGTLDCILVDSAPNAVGEMAIIATDSAGGTYWVTKLYNNTVRLTPNTGSQFTAADKVKWARDGVAVVDYSVSITY